MPPTKRVPDEAYRITVKEIAEKLRNARRQRVRSTLLIGAGCSVSAGIPTCPTIIEDIKAKYPEAHARARRTAGGDADYGACMAVLDTGERRALIERYVRKAKINWAHLAIACLMDRGYVDRVLTTNFDNLVVRAASLLGIFPGVYDMTLYRASGDGTDAPLVWEALPRHAVFHLHGQTSGFQLLNTADDLARHAPHVGDCFRFAEGERPWIVVGYSGENDPIFRAHIRDVHRFGRSLYWVGYKEEGVPEEVHDALFTQDKQARYVHGQDADRFFIALAQELGAFPPGLIREPLPFLRRAMDLFPAFPEPGTQSKANVFQIAISDIEAAIRRANDPLPAVALLTEGTVAPPEPAPAGRRKAAVLRLEGKHQEIVRLYEESDEAGRAEIQEETAGAYFQLAYDAYERALALPAVDSLPEIDRVIGLYRRALALAPDDYDVHNNLGIALTARAERGEPPAAPTLFKEAAERLRRAVELRPDDPVSYYNLGYALDAWAQIAPAPEAATHYAEAIGAYRGAVERKSDHGDALSNWAASLYRWGKLVPDAHAADRFRESAEVYRRAQAAKPNDPAIPESLGAALTERGKLSTGLEAVALLKQAREALEDAERLNPGQAAYNLACLAALDGDAAGCEAWLRRGLERKTLPEREFLVAEADFAAVRDADWFHAFLQDAYPGPPAKG